MSARLIRDALPRLARYPGTDRRQLRQIEEGLAHLEVQGDRYPAHVAARTGRLGQIW